MTAPEDQSNGTRGSLSAAVETLAERLASAGVGAKERVQGLRGPARAALVAALYRRSPRPMLVVARDTRAAEALAQDLHFFLGEEPSADALKKRLHVLPAWDVAPFAPISPSPETIAHRIEGLYHLSQTRNPIVLTTPEAALQRVMAPAVLTGSCAYLVQGGTVDLDELAARLSDWGYKRRPLVEERGEFAVRGGLVDVFVTGQGDPLRLELLGDVLESIRTFDPATQRRLADQEEALVLPAGEFPVRAMRDPGVARRIEARARELEMSRADRLQLLDALREGIHFPGVEALAPYLVDLVDLPAYLPRETLVVLDEEDAIAEAARAAWASVEEHAATAAEERQIHPPAEDLYSTPDRLLAALAERPRLVLEELSDAAAAGGDARVAQVRSRRPFEVQGARFLREEKGFGALAERLRGWTRAGSRVGLVVHNAAQAERLKRILEGQDLLVDAAGDSLPDVLERRPEPGPFIVAGDLSESVELPDDRLVCLAEANLFGEHRHTRRRKAVALTLDQVMKSLEQLRPDDYIVHLDHGIGLYRGLKHLTVAGSEGDFLHLEYQGGDRLYVPVDRVNVVQKYVGGDGAQPLLDKLGGVAWERTKTKAKESILAMAHELLALYATRERHEGHAFSTSDAYYQEFEARFPFDETPDQQRAINEVLGDLGKSKPMDRLVCGDVGYGKTEVAMRAAFICAMEGQQVGVLVPTTVLAQQHVETFRKRFAGYPVRIEMMSGFRTRKENADVAAKLATGEIDVVVGTHRLLQGDVEFARLGLLVVDEEHRFGVKDKERIKQMRKLVDVLTLTATPIPRTLELSLTGIRDLSVIETPPLDRQAIRTYVTRFDDHVIRDAVKRELDRGGQIFFVHNRVESIDRMAERLRAIVPEARIVVGHGQMKEHQLEKVMLAFLNHEHDILLCTAIIESGLDIPNANTIFIDRADTFGLAQLYQLRGRVGRSPARAYAYLLIPGAEMLTREARQRLEVLEQLDDLGGGFKIAAHDLEIRGAGNLLGKQQSGHITAVGFELYTQMMEQAVHELRGEPVEVEIEPEIQLGIPAYIPDSYLDDVNQRLVWYKRLAAMKRPEDRVLLGEEMRDRYGPPPAIVELLLDVMDVRRRMKALGIAEAKLRGPRLALKLHPSSMLPPAALVDWVRAASSRASLAPDGTLAIPTAARGEALLGEVRTVLASLEGLLPDHAEAPSAGEASRRFAEAARAGTERAVRG
ncbi:MAG TPA: transcription-repair coupling factor [Candidatus Binatia bacterium]|nr:transcription-repair coupling factor [Candidatus Binatia bacterium]